MFLVAWLTDNFHNNLTRHPIMSSSNINMTMHNAYDTRRHVGRCKDSLHSCFTHDCWHLVLCNATYFLLVVISQVTTRLDLLLLGKLESSKKTIGPATFIK